MLSGIKMFTANSKRVTHYCNSLIFKTKINIFINLFPVSNIYIRLHIAKLGSRMILRKQEIKKKKAVYTAEIEKR